VVLGAGRRVLLGHALLEALPLAAARDGLELIEQRSRALGGFIRRDAEQDTGGG
jgi:hypothetical protein